MMVLFVMFLVLTMRFVFLIVFRNETRIRFNGDALLACNHGAFLYCHFQTLQNLFVVLSMSFRTLTMSRIMMSWWVRPGVRPNLNDWLPMRI